MSAERYYWWLSHSGLPCQHCGHSFDPAMIVGAWSSGKIHCPNCRQHLPQFDQRDYGVKKGELWSIVAHCEPSAHWTTSFKNRPLWAI